MTLATKLRELGDANKYEEQGKYFLEATDTRLSVTEAVSQRSPLWHKKGEKHGINYWVTLLNPRGSYGFNYWGSIADAEKIRHGEGRGTKPTAYDILTAVRPTGSDTFEEFCSEFGYDEDSRMAEKTFKACQEQDANMRRLFTSEELEALNEIA